PAVAGKRAEDRRLQRLVRLEIGGGDGVVDALLGDTVGAAVIPEEDLTCGACRLRRYLQLTFHVSLGSRTTDAPELRGQHVDELVTAVVEPLRPAWSTRRQCVGRENR